MRKLRSEEELVSNWIGDINKPVVSICCVTYNHSEFLEDALEGFLNQDTDFPFEIIIHDDASTDGTTDIVMEYAKKYPSIIKPIVQTENQFSKASLLFPRLVLPQAIGKYIALCDGDDYWTDNKKLQMQIDFLEDNLDYVITYSDCQSFDDTGHLDIVLGGATRDLDSEELMKSTPIYTMTSCFRNVIKTIPQDLMSARYGDLVIWSLLGAYGRGKYLPDIKPTAYRIHGGGVHSTKNTRHRAMMQLITYSSLLAYYQRLSNDKLSRYFMVKIFKSCIRMVGIISIGKYIINKFRLKLTRKM